MQMQPSDEFWTEAVRNSPSGLVVILLAVVAVLFVAVRWGLPLVKELRIKRLEIDRYRIEVDERSAQQLDDRERERIRITQQQVEQQRESNESLRALAANVAASTAHTDVLVAELKGARDRSREMGGEVKEMHAIVGTVADLSRETHAMVDTMAGRVLEMHEIVVRKD